MVKILQKDEKALRGKTLNIPIREITTPKIRKVIREMTHALKSQDDGVALAGPQIGYSLQIFVVSGKIFHKDFMKGEDLNKKIVKKEIPKGLIFINPVISKLSREKIWIPEGCLSVRWLYGMTYRSQKATITAYNEYGKKFTRGASGLLAQIFQHETDHLKGILFTDHAVDIKEEKPK